MAYCTVDDLKNFFSTSGVEAFTDQDTRGSNQATQDCIDQATDEINIFVLRRYEITVAETSKMLKRWCIVLTTFFLCESRGCPVPDSIAAEAQRINDRLEKIQSGEFRLPGVMQKAIGSSSPTFSNLTVDRRFGSNQVRVVQQASSNIPSQLGQDFAGGFYGQ